MYRWAVAMSSDEYTRLTELIEHRFSGVDGQFAQINDNDRQLVEFLGQKFAQVDAQFVQVRREIQRVDQRVDELGVELRGEINEFRGEFNQFRGEVRAEFGEVRDLIRLSHGDLDRRVRRLEEEG